MVQTMYNTSERNARSTPENNYGSDPEPGEIIEDAFILNTKDPDVPGIHVFVAQSVVGGCGRVLMRGPIHFDHQAFRRAVEVRDEGAYTVLPSEFPPIKLPTAQRLP